MTDREIEVRRHVREWIARKRGVDVGVLADDTPLVAGGYLNSLMILELMLFLEQLAERPLDVRQLRPGTFRDVDSIYARFFGEKTP